MAPTMPIIPEVYSGPRTEAMGWIFSLDLSKTLRE